MSIACLQAATDHGHIFWIHDGSIRSDINLQESITVDLHFRTTNLSNHPSITDSSENGQHFV